MEEEKTNFYQKELEKLKTEEFNKESKFDSVNETFTGTKVKSQDHSKKLYEQEKEQVSHTIIVKKTPSKEIENFEQMTSDTPVCHLLYENIDNGSFYLQWKPNSKEQFENSILMMVPEKSVPKFKLSQDGGRAALSHKVAPDKMKFYSYICQFLKLAKDYNSKFQLMKGWNSEMPYKCDLYLHYEDNKVVKVENEHLKLDQVNCVAVVATSNKMSSKMTKEQMITNVRNVGYVLSL